MPHCLEGVVFPDCVAWPWGIRGMGGCKYIVLGGCKYILLRGCKYIVLRGCKYILLRDCKYIMQAEPLKERRRENLPPSNPHDQAEPEQGVGIGGSRHIVHERAPERNRHRPDRDEHRRSSSRMSGPELPAVVPPPRIGETEAMDLSMT